jgi:hypothetical protein
MAPSTKPQGRRPRSFGGIRRRYRHFLSPHLTQQRKTATMKMMVGLGRLELPTSRLSSARSNQLSYKPETLVCASCATARCKVHASRATARCDPRKHYRTFQQYLKTKDSHASVSHARDFVATAARARPGRKRNEGGEVPQNGPLIKA